METAVLWIGGENEGGESPHRANFLGHEPGRTPTTYRPVKGESLPFNDFSFAEAVSGDYLFMASDDDLSWHLQLIHELARVAKDVRIILSTDANGKPSPLLGPVLLQLHQANYGVEVNEMPAQSSTVGHAILHVWAQQCHMDSLR